MFDPNEGCGLLNATQAMHYLGVKTGLFYARIIQHLPAYVFPGRNGRLCRYYHPNDLKNFICHFRLMPGEPGHKPGSDPSLLEDKIKKLQNQRN